VITITLRACAICGRATEFGGESYPHFVCETCDSRALAVHGGAPAVDPTSDAGENPVFIDGRQCWRRYRFGGWRTMSGPDRVDSIDAYYEKHMDPKLVQAPPGGVPFATRAGVAAVPSVGRSTELAAHAASASAPVPAWPPKNKARLSDTRPVRGGRTARLRRGSARRSRAPFRSYRASSRTGSSGGNPRCTRSFHLG